VAGEDLQPNSGFLLDTGVIIRYLRGNKRAADLLDFLQAIGEISVSAITYMEILIRCQPHEEESTRLFFDRVPPFIVSREVASKAAFLIRKYQTVFGHDNPRQYPDAIIAATAWQQQGVLVTLNKKHFGRIHIDEFAVQIIDQDAEDWISLLKL
jgi:predicted nucleic acid-binding protein